MFVTSFLFVLFSLQTDAMQSNAEVLAALQQLHEISLREPRSKNRVEQIENLNTDVQTILHPLSIRQLAQLAVAAQAMTSGLAEHAAIDEVYWTAFWSAAHRLSDDPSKEAGWALTKVAEMSGIDDGGDGMVLRELLAHQAKLRQTPNP